MLFVSIQLVSYTLYGIRSHNQDFSAESSYVNVLGLRDINMCFKNEKDFVFL